MDLDNGKYSLAEDCGEMMPLLGKIAIYRIPHNTGSDPVFGLAVRVTGFRYYTPAHGDYDRVMMVRIEPIKEALGFGYRWVPWSKLML